MSSGQETIDGGQAAETGAGSINRLPLLRNIHIEI